MNWTQFLLPSCNLYAHYESDNEARCMTLQNSFMVTNIVCRTVRCYGHPQTVATWKRTTAPHYSHRVPFQALHIFLISVFNCPSICMHLFINNLLRSLHISCLTNCSKAPFNNEQDELYKSSLCQRCIFMYKNHIIHRWQQWSLFTTNL